MNKKIVHYTKEIIFFVITITVLANIVSFYKSGDLNKSPLNIVNITLLDKQAYILQKNKPILIHFWASWCPTCKLEASNIQKLSEHFEVLTIAVKSGTDAEIKKYLDENNFDFNVLNDNSGFISSEFNIAAFPTTFIYDKEKNLAFSEVGYTSTFGLWLRMLWAGF
ncbi:redoxin domain-containing protein [bacterium]|nr:redoxin domain-containing protein [bacterium]